MLLLDIFFDWAVSSVTSNHVSAQPRATVSPAFSMLILHLYLLVLSIMQLVLSWKLNRQLALSLLCLEFLYIHTFAYAGSLQGGVLVCPFSSVQFPNPVYSVKSNITASSFTNSSEDLQRESTYVLFYLNTYTATYILTIILQYLPNLFTYTYIFIQHLISIIFS